MKAGRLTIAMYLRISDEDGDMGQGKKTESDSIVNQRNMLLDFIERSSELKDAEVLEFCDDGFSGRNFERPAIKEMLEKVRQGEIQCIVVKDLSRFGRDYLTAGNYILRVFPFLGVRFIAVGDGFDSSRRPDIDSLDTSFKLLLHDLYSRDLSRKVRSAQQLRAWQGEFLSSFAPFGYVKDVNNRKRLAVDPAAAEIVRSIFDMAAEGVGTVGIARTLNEKKVPTPMQYKREAGCTRKIWGCAHENNFWNHNTVAKILKDARYIGSNIYGKKRQTGAGTAESVDREEWIIVENAHEGIVTREKFDRVQEQIQRRAKRERGEGNRAFLCGKVRCGICGYAMTRMKTKQPCYSCQTFRVTDIYHCPMERIPERDLEKIILEDLRIRVGYGMEADRIWEAERCRGRCEEDSRKKSLMRLKSILADTDNRIRKLYEQFALGELEKEAYIAQKAVCLGKKEDICTQIRKAESRQINLYRNQKEVCQGGVEESQWLSAKAAAGLLREIIVYPDRKLKIVWNYREEIENLLD